jgi:hypothetical protein
VGRTNAVRHTPRKIAARSFAGKNLKAGFHRRCYGLTPVSQSIQLFFAGQFACHTEKLEEKQARTDSTPIPQASLHLFDSQ